jgi:DNA-binding transcriptional LysR family regulator
MRPTSTHDESTTPATAAIGRLRLLDFDDLFLLKTLLTGATIADTARQLGLTQPAITQRVRKIERVFADALLQKVGRHVRLTAAGRAICQRAAEALSLMDHVAASQPVAAATVAAPAEMAAGWLWSALAHIQAGEGDVRGATWHVQIASGDELLALVEAGQVDAAITMATPAHTGLSTQDIGEDEFVLVAAPGVAAGIKTASDLATLTLIDLDRSLPLWRRIAAPARDGLRVGRTWALSEISMVMTAVMAGQGMAVLPRRLIDARLQAGSLAVVLPELEILPARYLLVTRADRAADANMQALYKALTAKG